MTITISVIAIILSLASFCFGIYQYKIGAKIKVNEKANRLLKEIYELRRNIEDKKNIYSNTDDIPDYKDVFESHIIVTEDLLAKFLQKKTIKIDDFYEIERVYLDHHLEFDLFCKQVDESIRFNKECINSNMKPIEFDNYE